MDEHSRRAAATGPETFLVSFSERSAGVNAGWIATVPVTFCVAHPKGQAAETAARDAGAPSFATVL